MYDYENSPEQDLIRRAKRGDIKAFLQPPVMDKTEEVIISDRFKGADGKPAPFVIRVISQEVNDKLSKDCNIRKKINGQIVTEFDNYKYQKKLILACVVEPDFKSAELCSYYKAVDPLDVPGRMLSVGEFNKLAKAIMKLNEIAATDAEIEELVEEAKN